MGKYFKDSTAKVIWEILQASSDARDDCLADLHLDPAKTDVWIIGVHWREDTPTQVVLRWKRRTGGEEGTHGGE